MAASVSEPWPEVEFSFSVSVSRPSISQELCISFISVAIIKCSDEE
ncbi:rCG47770, partial [Rattus norvegicus]